MDGQARRPDRTDTAGEAGHPVATETRSDGTRASYRATVRTERQHHLGRWVVVVVLAVVVVVVKPWGGSVGGPDDAPPPRTSPIVAASNRPTSLPSPTPAGARVAGICIDVGAWLLASVELDGAQTMRVWRAIPQASSAIGPRDEAIPLTQIRSDGVLGLGWCGPLTGPDAATEQADVQAWRIDASVVTSIPLVATEGTTTSGFGALYRPTEPKAKVWAPGTYVFRHRTSDGREHWFSLRLLAKTRAG